jgi:hypothetical protein
VNAHLEGAETVSQQTEPPFEYLRRDLKGAFCHPWWAMVDALRTALPGRPVERVTHRGGW